jgi:hypothetical protein
MGFHGDPWGSQNATLGAASMDLHDLHGESRTSNDSSFVGLLASEGSTNNMRNMSLGITAFVVSVGMISVGAQGRSFSGTWVIDSEKTAAAAQAAGDQATMTARPGGSGGRVMSGGSGGSSVAATGGGGTGTRSIAGGGGGVMVGGTGGAAAATAGGGGGGGRVVINADTVIAIDANTFSTTIGGVHTSYPLNGTEVTVQLRNTEARAKASWKGDMLVIETTMETANGPMTSTTSWFIEGDSLVRLTTRKTYYKKK